ncbi:MAG: PAS domain-containing protein [Comamonadaceae bacterium]|nr:PAS domain-containing protein [Comamonadaceae bacterium]
MADGAGVVDGDGRIVVCNPAWAAMLGAPSPEAALGRRAGDWLAAPAWAEVAARLAAADTLPAEDLALRGQTETLPAEASFAVAERAPGGAPARVPLVLRDVRARRARPNAPLVAAREAAEAANRGQERVPGEHEPRDPHADERR